MEDHLRLPNLPHFSSANSTREIDMAEYILFMHDDVVADDQGAWEPYLHGRKSQWQAYSDTEK